MKRESKEWTDPQIVELKSYLWSKNYGKLVNCREKRALIKKLGHPKSSFDSMVWMLRKEEMARRAAEAASHDLPADAKPELGSAIKATGQGALPLITKMNRPKPNPKASQNTQQTFPRWNKFLDWEEKLILDFAIKFPNGREFYLKPEYKAARKILFAALRPCHTEESIVNKISAVRFLLREGLLSPPPSSALPPPELEPAPEAEIRLIPDNPPQESSETPSIPDDPAFKALDKFNNLVSLLVSAAEDLALLFMERSSSLEQEIKRLKEDISGVISGKKK